MIEPDLETRALASDEAAIDRILRSGARGAVWLAGIATAIVLLLWLAFYFFVFVPRAPSP
jgi:hypothetical protein